MFGGQNEFSIAQSVDFDLNTRIEANASRTEVIKGVFGGQNKSSIAQSVNLDLKAGVTVAVQKYVGGASSDVFEDPKSAARNASRIGASRTWIRGPAAIAH